MFILIYLCKLFHIFRLLTHLGINKIRATRVLNKSWKKIYSRTATQSVPLLQPEHGFCQQTGPDPSEQMLVVPVSLNGRCYSSGCVGIASISWDIPESVVDYCLGSVTMIFDFVGYLQTDWSLKSSDVTGYMNTLGYLLGCSRTFSQKLQWFNKNTRFSIYFIWNIYSTSETIPIQKKLNPIGEKLWVLIIWTVSTAGLSLKNCKRLFYITPKNINI